MCASASALCENVSQERARAFAAGFLGADGKDLEMVYCGRDAGTKASEADAPVPFYTFNRDGGGYVMVSAVNNMKPVIAFSGSESFDPDNVNPTLKWWLEGVAKTVEHYRSQRIEATAEVVDAWKNSSSPFSSTKAEVEGYLCKTPAWNQGSPFNTSCPSVTGGRALTGCVPTAIAEVMCYNHYPSAAPGTVLPSYTFSYKNKDYTVSSRTLDTVYDWTSLSEVTDSNASSQSSSVKENLARLLADVGQAMQVSYGVDGTGGHEGLVPQKLSQYFGYSKKAYARSRDCFEPAQWFSLIQNELKSGRPVIYGGQSDEGGHCFVIDGVSASYLDLVQINWGWGSNPNDKWYDLGANFYGNQDAIFNFMAPGNDEPDSLEEGVAVLEGGDVFTVSGTPGNGSFSVDVEFIVPEGGSGSLTADFILARFDKDGNYKDNVSSVNNSEMSVPYMYTMTFSSCSIASNIEFGDRIMLLYKRSSDQPGSWSAVQSIQGGASSHYPLSAHPRIVASNSYSTGNVFYLRLDNLRYAYMYSAYSTSSSYASQGRLCEWDFYVDGELYKSIHNITDHYIILDKAGEWTVRCKMYPSFNTSAPAEILTTSFQVN